MHLPKFSSQFFLLFYFSLLTMLSSCGSTPVNIATSNSTAKSTRTTIPAATQTVTWQKPLTGSQYLNMPGDISMATEQIGWAWGYTTDPKNYNGSLYRTTDGGQTWQQVVLPNSLSTKDIQDLEVFDKNMAILDTKNQLVSSHSYYRTIDGGVTWQPYHWPNSNDNPAPDNYYSSFLNYDNGWVEAIDSQDNNATLFSTHDGGQTWREVSTLSSSGGSLTFTDPHTGFLTGMNNQKEPTLSITHDNGVSWHLLALPDTLSGKTLQVLDDLTFFSHNEGYLLAYFGNASKDTTQSVYLFTTRDGGNTWTRGSQIVETYTSYAPLNIIDSTHIQTLAPAPVHSPTALALLCDKQGQCGGTIPGYSAYIVLLTLVNGQWSPTSRREFIFTSASLGGYSFPSSQVGLAVVSTVDKNKYFVYKTSDGGKNWLKLGNLPKGA